MLVKLGSLKVKELVKHHKDMNPPKEKKQRQRDSLMLSEKGQSLVKEALHSKGWSKPKWIKNVDIYVSISTATRLLRRKKIDRPYFEALCKVFNLDLNDLIADPNDQLDSTTPSISLLVPPLLIPLPSEQSPTQPSGTHFQSFMITGTFSPDKLEEIEIAFQHLEKLLSQDCTFTLRRDKGYLAVSGKFSEHQKVQLEITLDHLEKLLLEHCITPEWNQLFYLSKVLGCGRKLDDSHVTPKNSLNNLGLILDSLPFQANPSQESQIS